jgi:hypothetical protein
MKIVSRAAAVLVLTLFSLSLAAQPPQAPPPTPAPEPQQVLARELLEGSLLQARGLEQPEARAYTLMQVGQAYLGVDRGIAREALGEAFQATLSIEDDPRGDARRQLQGWVLEALVPFGAGAVEELLPQAVPDARHQAITRLVISASREKQFDRALAMLDLVDPDSELPYPAVTELMMRLPEDRSAERQQLFLQALTRFAAQKPQQGIMVGNDIAALVGRFWRLVPPAVALQGIDLVLDRSRRPDEQPLQMTVSTPQGAASFGSAYEFRLFQVLPALQHLDSGRAERLLREHRGLAGTLQQHPEGMRSLDPTFRETPPAEGESSSVSVSVRGGAGGGGPGPGALEDRMAAEWEVRGQRIVEDAGRDPKQALAAAMTLPESVGRSAPRARTLLEIARLAAEKNPSIAREALRELAPLIAALPDPRQTQFLTAAGRLSLRMNDEDGAQSLIRQGMKLARVRYSQDSDRENPNTAPKSMWPSTELYRQLVRLAAEVSPRLALELMTEIEDEEVQLAQRVMLASAWLGQASGASLVVERRKDGRQSTWISSPGSEQRQEQRRP